MKTYVQRVVSISYAVEEIQFKTDEEFNAFHAALGRMVAHGIASDRPRDIEFVNLAINHDLEITGVYFPAWSRGETYSENKVQYDLDNAFNTLRDGGQPFVMGGIPRDGGVRYTFHS